MIERKQAYQGRCNNCKVLFFEKNGDVPVRYLFGSKRYLTEELKANGWKRKGKKWFCPDCQGGKG